MIKLLAKIKLITETIYVITTTLNDQNHISENRIGSVIICFILTEVPFVYMERAFTWPVPQPATRGRLRARSFTLKDEWDTCIGPIKGKAYAGPVLILIFFFCFVWKRRLTPQGWVWSFNFHFCVNSKFLHGSPFASKEPYIKSEYF